MIEFLIGAGILIGGVAALLLVFFIVSFSFMPILAFANWFVSVSVLAGHSFTGNEPDWVFIWFAGSSLLMMITIVAHEYD
jgi:hypothetical protein